MEAMTGASAELVAVCTGHGAVVQSRASKRVNLTIPARKAFCSGTAIRTSLLSTDFEDQSHVQFYLNVRCSRKEKMNKRAPKALGKGMDNCQEGMRGMDERKERKRMQKMRGGKRMGTSSSSSSSSESDCSDYETRDLMTVERDDDIRTGTKFPFEFQIKPEQPREMRRTRKFDVEQFRKEWEELSRSELMNSIPRFTPDFQIEPPLTVDIQHLQKSYNLPTIRPPPPMVVDSTAVEEPSSAAVSPNSNISHSLVTVAGVAVLEDISAAFSATEIRPASAHVDVCMGGKCKKAGAGEVLNAFQVAGRPGVSASPCKCMKNCKSAVSVRIQDQDGTTQVYTAVNLEDVDVLLQKHCSTSTFVTGVSSFDSQQFFREPEADL